MRRRELLAIISGVAAGWPTAARVQQPGRVRRLGVLMGTAESDPDQRAMVSELTRALAALGWKDGENVRIEHRWAAGDPSRLQAHAGELARMAPDAIFVQGTPGTTALRQAAPTTPLVFVNVSDPISTGLVSSLAHPGGNITGFTNYEFSMGGKWLGILKELAPSITRVGVVHNPGNPALPGLMRSIEAGGSTLGIRVSAAPGRSAEDFERTIDAFASEGSGGGLLVLLDFLTLTHRDRIIALAARRRLPVGYGLRVFAESGGLISYGVDAADLFRRAASYVDRILKGAKPADLPVQQPIKFELVINLKTANALGLTVPLTLQASADAVIE